MATEITPEQSNEADPTPPDEVYSNSPWKYLRTMALVAWSAFRHPFSTTIIDFDTGEMRQESARR
jgi:hypothetical protein